MRKKVLLAAFGIASVLALLLPQAASASTFTIGVQDYRWAAYGDFSRSRVDCRESITRFDRDTPDDMSDDLLAGRNFCDIVYGAKRLVDYSTRLYEVVAPLLSGACPTGYGTIEGHKCVRVLVANEEDVFSGEGSLPDGVVRQTVGPAAIPGTVCHVAARTGTGIRWFNNVLGNRAEWSKTVRNPRAPITAACP